MGISSSITLDDEHRRYQRLEESIHELWQDHEEARDYINKIIETIIPSNHEETITLSDEDQNKLQRLHDIINENQKESKLTYVSVISIIIIIVAPIVIGYNISVWLE